MANPGKQVQKIGVYYSSLKHGVGMVESLVNLPISEQFVNPHSMARPNGSAKVAASMAMATFNLVAPVKEAQTHPSNSAPSSGKTFYLW